MPSKIRKIIAEEILDSRGKPTLKVVVSSGDAEASFAVPSGASTGKHEAHELRDGNKELFDGQGVKKAAANVNDVIFPALRDLDVTRQSKIDKILLELDGTPDKDRLGCNALIGVSIACAKTAAKSKRMEVFDYLRELTDIKPSRKIPLLFMNLINGGKHASSSLAFQEYQVIPQTDNIETALDMVTDVQKTLKHILIKEMGPGAVNFGDEGGFAPNLDLAYRPLEMLVRAISECGLGDRIKLGLDTAASSFFEKNKYLVDNEYMTADQLYDYYRRIMRGFELFSIEDPFQEDDFASFASLKKEYPGLFVIGDDLTVTNSVRLEKAIRNRSINAIIIKPNQIGTLSETLETMRIARGNDIECIVSHRSGETEDDFIADLAYAFGCFGLKAGAPQHGERVVKYNRLKHIAAMNHSRAQIIATIGPASRSVEILNQMIGHQMDAARLNFSWGTYEEHAEYIKNIRQAAEMNGRRVPIIQDLSGPRIQKVKEHGFDEAAVEIITEKDLRDLNFGISQGVEYVAMSYVGDGKDIIKLRDRMKEVGRVIPIIAKIERKKALENLDEIIAVADAIMVARGDLGKSIPIEKVPFAQKEIIQKARKAKKPVITATQMLFSMVENPEPTRAEVSDISDAISEGSDAVMLSEETANGKYPVEAVAIMERIVLEVEKHGHSKEIHQL